MNPFNWHARQADGAWHYQLRFDRFVLAMVHPWGFTGEQGWYWTADSDDAGVEAISTHDDDGPTTITAEESMLQALAYVQKQMEPSGTAN